MSKSKRRSDNSLWTRDFTIITAGSAVSMFGNAMSGFAMNLMVLDISKSTLLYAVYIAMYTVPQMFVPIISGAFLDRYSRKKTIYTLDFISAGLYLIMAGALIGELASGLATQVIAERTVLMTAMLINAVMALLIIGSKRKEVSYIYNREN